MSDLLNEFTTKIERHQIVLRYLTPLSTEDSDFETKRTKSDILMKNLMEKFIFEDSDGLAEEENYSEGQDPSFDRDSNDQKKSCTDPKLSDFNSLPTEEINESQSPKNNPSTLNKKEDPSISPSDLPLFNCQEEVESLTIETNLSENTPEPSSSANLSHPNESILPTTTQTSASHFLSLFGYSPKTLEKSDSDASKSVSYPLSPDKAAASLKPGADQEPNFSISFPSNEPTMDSSFTDNEKPKHESVKDKKVSENNHFLRYNIEYLDCHLSYRTFFSGIINCEHY